MILSIDQGTTNSKAILVGHAGQVAGYGAAPVGLASPAARVDRAGCGGDLVQRAGRRGRLSGICFRHGCGPV